MVLVLLEIIHTRLNLSHRQNVRSSLLVNDHGRAIGQMLADRSGHWRLSLGLGLSGYMQTTVGQLVLTRGGGRTREDCLRL